MTNRAINKRAGGFGARPPGVPQRRVDGFLRSSRSIGKEAMRVWRAGRPSAIAQRGTNGATEDALLLGGDRRGEGTRERLVDLRA
jgi:hypothetical protein